MLDNWKVKIVVLFLASIFWFFVVSSYDQIRSVDNAVNIVPLNLSEDLAILNTSRLPKVKVYYKINDRDLYQVNIGVNDVVANIDLEGISVGEHKIPIVVDTTHPDIEIVKFTPMVLTVKIEPKVSENFIPKLEYTGDVASGYVLKDMSSDDESITVTGAKSTIEQVHEVRAEVQLIGVESTDHSKKGDLFAYDIYGKKLQEVTVLPSNINVRLEVGLDEETKTVGIIPDLERISLQDGYFIKAISIEPPVALIRGSHDILTKLDFLKTIRLTISDLSKDYTTLLDLELPSDVSIISPNDNRVSLHLELESLSYKREIEATLAPKNLSNIYDVIYENPLMVTFIGDPSTLDNVEKNDITFNIDFSDMNAVGKYGVDVDKSDFIYPQGLSLEDFSPKFWDINVVYK